LVELGKNLTGQAEVGDHRAKNGKHRLGDFTIFVKHRFLATMILPLIIAV
jgi:hypothetical protein